MLIERFEQRPQLQIDLERPQTPITTLDERIEKMRDDDVSRAKANDVKPQQTGTHKDDCK